MDLLQRVEDSECREGHHGQETVAQDTGYTAKRHGPGTHHTQKNVHPNTGCSTGPIHITKVSFTCLNMRIRRNVKSHYCTYITVVNAE